MANSNAMALGLDFGTESVRAILVRLDGKEIGSEVAMYKHGQITQSLPTSAKKLPADFALQHPTDWLDASARAVRSAIRKAKADASKVIGVGVDFTSCTMLPALRDGTPLCLRPKFEKNPFSWPKLWKHHGAKSQTARINEVATQRGESFLSRYGGIIGLEWFFPKILETLEEAPAIYDATEVWLEAGDWYVWRLVGGAADDLPRSTCQAGYKAMWSREDGYPSAAFFKAIHPKMANVASEKMPGRLLSPGETAGGLCAEMAKKLGLVEGTPVSAAIIDAHAGVPGSGAAEPGTLVMVMGTSSCHMLNAKENKFVPGVAGIVDGGILPGFFGYETGQAAVGDAFDWLRRTLGRVDFESLSKEAAALPPGSDGVLCLDWMNGCRTPLMDGSLSGAFFGLTLNHGPAHFYRALLEASAFGVRWIVDLLQKHGVPVKKLVATGGLPHHNPLLVQIYADVLAKPIAVPATTQGPALGAAILGALAAGKKASGFRSAAAAIEAMASPKSTGISGLTRVVKPNPKNADAYESAYASYRLLAGFMAGGASNS